MSTNNENIIRVGSRKSELALIQTKYVISCLQKLFPDRKFEIHTMTTIGDRVLNKSLPKIGEKSLFTKDLEDALRNGGVDFVVHSLKDLPTSLPAGMAIGAVLKREDPRDALVLNEKHRGLTLKELPKDSVIGTSSLRRSAQLARSYPHLKVCDIRGNLNTRLAKLDAPNSKFSGIILAQAGLVRMGWKERVAQILEPDEIMYAVGQGALAVECRSNDEDILKMLSTLSDIDTECIILAERSFLKTLGGGCSAPVAVVTTLKRRINDPLSDFQLDLIGAVWSLDGVTKIKDEEKCFLDFDENSNEIIPSKRSKMSNDRGDFISRESSKSPSEKRKSPIIVDDSKASCSKSGGDCSSLDIEALINIHGDLFKKCPYSMKHEKDNAEEKSTAECPLNIPIGQDFMGDCPYVNTEQKVDMIEKCPITGRVAEHKKDVEKCPFASRLDVDETDKEINKIEKCPFLSQNQVKLIDYDINGKNIQPTIVDDSDTLFCGLFRHNCVKLEIFEKCEILGRTLAEKLILRGASDVMRIAQDEIRSKI